jgi:uncharacterized membrane protein YebE (DUF533 family)
MDAERLVGSLIEGALIGRRGRQRAMRRLTGGSGSLINAQTLLAAAGLAWGLFEAATQATGGPAAAKAVSPPPPSPPPPTGRDAAGLSPAVHPELLRLVRLTISAARADGDLSLEERGRILAKAREVGAETLVATELQTRHPLAEIVAGVTDERHREELYGLAYGIVGAGDGVTGAERIYLAQLAHLLGLEPGTAARLESAMEARPEAG